MYPKSRLTSPHHLVWLYDESLMDSLDAATYLDTTSELRKMGWKVTLVAAGPGGLQNVRDEEVFCISKPEIYFLKQVVFHLRFLRLFMPKMQTVDIILFNQMSAPWILVLRLVRHLNGQRRPLFVMDTRTVPMDDRDHENWNGRLRRAFYHLTHYVCFSHTIQFAWLLG